MAPSSSTGSEADPTFQGRMTMSDCSECETIEVEYESWGTMAMDGSTEIWFKLPNFRLGRRREVACRQSAVGDGGRAKGKAAHCLEDLHGRVPREDRLLVGNAHDSTHSTGELHLKVENRENNGSNQLPDLPSGWEARAEKGRRTNRKASTQMALSSSLLPSNASNPPAFSSNVNAGLRLGWNSLRSVMTAGTCSIRIRTTANLNVERRVPTPWLTNDDPSPPTGEEELMEDWWWGWLRWDDLRLSEWIVVRARAG